MTTIDRTDAPTAVFEQRLAQLEAADRAPESFDPIAALRRLEAVAHQYEVYVAASKEEGVDCEVLASVVTDLRAALRPAVVAGESGQQ